MAGPFHALSLPLIVLTEQGIVEHPYRGQQWRLPGTEIENWDNYIHKIFILKYKYSCVDRTRRCGTPTPGGIPGRLWRCRKTGIWSSTRMGRRSGTHVGWP